MLDTGRPVAHVVAEIGVGEQVPERWVRLQRQAAAAGDSGAVLHAVECAELVRPGRVNAEFRLGPEFLKNIRGLLRLARRSVCRFGDRA